LVWLAQEDPMRMKELERMPLIDYWFLLNRKLDALHRANKSVPQSRQMKPKKRSGHANNSR
jgi:hypothetical protein